jgi:hypothetical protein
MSYKYFVVSLPRTGTTSITEMADICGLKTKHCPFNYFQVYMDNNNYDFYSDTPVYVPSVIEKLCKRDDVKFIYIDRPYSEIFDSWVNYGLFKTYNEMLLENEKKTISKGRLIDFSSYHESFLEKKLTQETYQEIFEEHQNQVKSIIRDHNKDLLIYKFTDGWKPFCDFIGVEIPNQEIPKLNHSIKKNE